jgi:hypothetical protein
VVLFCCGSVVLTRFKIQMANEGSGARYFF